MLKNVDGDFPACMRLKKESIEDNAKKTERLKGRGGGRLQYNNVDGDMPLRLRKTERKNKGGSSSNEKNDEKRQNGERKQRFVRRFDTKEK